MSDSEMVGEGEGEWSRLFCRPSGERVGVVVMLLAQRIVENNTGS